LASSALAGAPGGLSIDYMEFSERFNMADYFLFDRIKEGKGARVALRTAGRSMTYAEVAAASNRAGGALREAGLVPQDRVLISLHDTPEFVATIFGALRIGAVVAMVNPLITADEMEYFLQYSRATSLVCAPEVARKLGPRAKEVQSLHSALVAGGDGPKHAPYSSFDEAVAAQPAEVKAHPTHRDDPAYWLFTSGTTGKPKANMHLHHDFPWNCERYAKAAIGYKPNDVTLSVPKLFFGYATGSNLFFPFAVGATACLFAERATPEAVFENIARFKPTLLVSVPTMVLAMAQHPDRSKHDLSCLRGVFSAGEALPAELYRQWHEAFKVEILDGIGSAELFHIYITNTPGDVEPGSLGRLVPGYEAKIVGMDGREVNPGDVGTLFVRGDSAATGYFDDKEKTESTFEEDWVRSADLFRVDKDGRYWYSGRTDDLLKVGGIFVSPLEIEDCLLRHPAVAECAAIPYQESGLEKPLAVVVARPGHEAGARLALELARFVKGSIAPYKFPRRVLFVDELPKNDRGKVERKRLRETVSKSGLKGTIDTDPQAGKGG
jgi:benzoate-CoA ligase family protein